MSEQMTKGDRDALIRIVKGRARQAKTEADQRAAVLQAEIEQEITAEYSARDEMWAEAVKIAEQAMAKANAEIEAVSAELGVPAKHAPGLTMGWRHRSPSYADKDRRAELRKLAERRVAALGGRPGRGRSRAGRQHRRRLRQAVAAAPGGPARVLCVRRAGRGRCGR